MADKQDGRSLIDESDFEAELEQRNLELKLKNAGLPKRYWDLPKLKKTTWNADAFALIERYLKGEIDGLLFVGRAGTGKTVLASLLTRGLIAKNGAEVQFVSVPSLLADLRDTFSKNNQQGAAQKVKNLIAAEHLILDDLGAEKTTDWTTEILYLIINGRYVEKKGIIVTSNCFPSELASRLGERTLSRLAEMCELVKFKEDEGAVDWRLENWK